jgi:hypothetical protein
VQMPLASSGAIRISSSAMGRMIQLGSGAGKMPDPCRPARAAAVAGDGYDGNGGARPGSARRYRWHVERELTPPPCSDGSAGRQSSILNRHSRGCIVHPDPRSLAIEPGSDIDR